MVKWVNVIQGKLGGESHDQEKQIQIVQPGSVETFEYTGMIE